MAEKCIFIIGGARSGKSRFAQELATGTGEKVLFVATAQAHDEEMRARIAEHRKNRPGNWRTLEITRGIGPALKISIGDAGVVVIDCLTLLISNLLGDTRYHEHEKRVLEEIEALIAAIDQLEASFIIVSNEVGLGLVPENRLGRQFRDLIGKAHQLIAGRATDVYFMVAGLPLKLK